MRAPALVLLVGFVFAATAAPARAQRGPVYCSVTEIKSEQLSNGVRVTIVTDGEVEWDWDFDRLIAEGAFAFERMPWGISLEPTEHFRSLPLRLRNAKSKLGSALVPVNKYPVSHVRISIPEWAQEGVGLEVEVVNYLGWVTGEGDFHRFRYNLYMDTSEDRSGIVVAWTSDRFPPPPPPAVPPDLPTQLAVEKRDGRLTVRAVNAKLQDVASAIARETGFPVSTPPDSGVRISLYLHDIPAEEVLRLLATSCGLSTRPCAEGGWVMAAGVRRAESYGAAASRTIPLRYLRAVDAVDLLPNFLVEYLFPDAETNSVVAAGPEWMLDRVAADLAKLDRPAPEVRVEVAAVEYTSGEALARDLKLQRFLGNWSAAVDTLMGELSFLWLEELPPEWDLLLGNLEAKSVGHLRSRSSLRVLNGRTARVFGGQQRYIVIERLEVGREAELEQVEIGTSLDVQPWLGEGEEVVVHLEIAINSLAGTDARTGLPVVARRNAETVVRIRDGQTILIAGLQAEDHSRQTRRVPILGDLPLVGTLFRASDRSQSETRLALFVTPHIVRPQLASEGECSHG